MEIKDLSTKWAAVVKEIKTKCPKNKELNNEAAEVAGMLGQFFARGDIQQLMEGPLEEQIKNAVAKAERTRDTLSDCIRCAKGVDLTSVPETQKLMEALEKELDDFLKGIKVVRKALARFQSDIG